MSAYKRILVAVDGSAASNNGLREAIRLAKAEGAKLSIVHVVNDYVRDRVHGRRGAAAGSRAAAARERRAHSGAGTGARGEAAASSRSSCCARC